MANLPSSVTCYCSDRASNACSHMCETVSMTRSVSNFQESSSQYEVFQFKHGALNKAQNAITGKIHPRGSKNLTEDFSRLSLKVLFKHLRGNQINQQN